MLKDFIINLKYVDRRRIHEQIYFVALLGIASCLVLSRFMLTVFQIVLIVNWLVEMDFSRKFRRMKENYSYVFLFIFLLSVVGLWQAHDLQKGFNVIKLQLPLLLLPLIIGSSPVINTSKTLTLLKVFIFSTLISTIVSLMVLLGLTPIEVHNYRDISILVSHIHLSLFIDLSLFFIFYWNMINPPFQRSGKVLLLILTIWFIVFLIILKSLTGIMVFAFVAVLVLKHFIHLQQRGFVKPLFRVLFLLLLGWGVYYGVRLYQDFTPEEIQVDDLEMYTAQGNKYHHDLEKKYIENGHYVFLYVCDKELFNGWVKRSQMPYHGKNGQKGIRTALLRFLTSKGYRKDASGLAQLSDEEVRAIENRVANYYYTYKYSLYSRLHEVAWDIYVYHQTGDARGKSIAGRIEAFKTGLLIAQDNWVKGIGTGNIAEVFESYYRYSNSVLVGNEKEFISHNTFLNAFIKFGLPGFVLFTIAFFLPVWKNKGLRKELFQVIFVVVLLSMLVTNGLKHQIEVTYTAFFYALFLFGSNYKRLKVSNNQ